MDKLPTGTWTYEVHPNCAIVFQADEAGKSREVARVANAASASFICEMCNGVELNELRCELEKARQLLDTARKKMFDGDDKENIRMFLEGAR